MQFSTEYAVKGLDQAMVDDEDLPNDYKPPAKMNSRDLIDGTDLPKYGPSAPFRLEVSKELNELSIEAWKLARKQFETLSDLDKKSTSPNSIAIEIYKQLVDAYRKTETKTSTLDEAKPMSISKSVRRSTPPSASRQIDLSSIFQIPGLSLEPSAPPVSIDLQYFDVNGQRLRSSYKVDHVIFTTQPDTDEVEFFVTVTDQRRGEEELNNLPVVESVAFDDAVVSIDLVNEGNQYRITADHGTIEFSFGVFFFMLFFVKQAVEVSNG